MGNHCFSNNPWGTIVFERTHASGKHCQRLVQRYFQGLTSWAEPFFFSTFFSRPEWDDDDDGDYYDDDDDDDDLPIS